MRQHAGLMGGRRLLPATRVTLLCLGPVASEDIQEEERAVPRAVTRTWDEGSIAAQERFRGLACKQSWIAAVDILAQALDRDRNAA